MADSMLLWLLQGGGSFWGLETLCADGVVSSEKDVELFILAQLSQRWFQFEWPIIIIAAARTPTMRRPLAQRYVLR